MKMRQYCRIVAVVTDNNTAYAIAYLWAFAFQTLYLLLDSLGGGKNPAYAAPGRRDDPRAIYPLTTFCHRGGDESQRLPLRALSGER